MSPHRGSKVTEVLQEPLEIKERRYKDNNHLNIGIIYFVCTPLCVCSAYVDVFIRADVMISSLHLNCGFVCFHSACFSQGAPGTSGYPGAAGAIGPPVSIQRITSNNRLVALCITSLFALFPG